MKTTDGKSQHVQVSSAPGRPWGMRRAMVAVARVVSAVVVPFLFSVVALWVAIYFVLNGSWALDYVRTRLPKGMAIEAFSVGPMPFAMRVAGVAFTGDGVDAGVGRMTGHASFWPLGVDAIDVDFDTLVVRVDKAASSGDKDKPKKVFSLADIPTGELPFIGSFRGSIGSVFIEGAEFGVALVGVRVTHGTRGVADGAVMTARVDAERCEFSLPTTGIAWGAATCGFELRNDQSGPSYSVRGGLDDASGSTIQLEVHAFRDGAGDQVEVRADLAVSAAVMGLAVSDGSFGNAAIGGLHIGPVPLTGSVEKVALRWSSIMFGGADLRDFAVSEVAAGPGSVVIEPDGLLTRVHVDFGATAAAHMRVFDVAVEDLHLGRLSIDFDKRFEGTVEGFGFGDWKSGDTHLGAGHGDFLLTAGLTGGSLHGTVALAEGVLGGSVSVKRSPLGGRVSVGARFGGADVGGALLGAFTRDHPELSVAGPKEVRATLEDVGVVVEKGEIEGATALVIDEMALVVGGVRWFWDGIAWSGGEGTP